MNWQFSILNCTFNNIKAAIRFFYSYNIDSRTDFIVGEGLFARKVLYETSRPDFQILLSDLACITKPTASSNSASLDFSLTFESFSESSSCRTWNKIFYISWGDWKICDSEIKFMHNFITMDLAFNLICAGNVFN